MFFEYVNVDEFHNLNGKNDGKDNVIVKHINARSMKCETHEINMLINNFKKNFFLGITET